MGKSKAYSIKKPVKRYERSFEQVLNKVIEDIGPEEEAIVQANITANPGDKSPAGLTKTGKQAPGDDAAQESKTAITPPDSTGTLNKSDEMAYPSGLKKIRRKKPKRRGKL